jgi:hypothetical protein
MVETGLPRDRPGQFPRLAEAGARVDGFRAGQSQRNGSRRPRGQHRRIRDRNDLVAVGAQQLAAEDEGVGNVG